MRSFGQALRFIPAERRVFWFALVPLSLLRAGVEALCAAAVFGLVAVLQQPDAAATMPLVGWLSDAVGPAHSSPIGVYLALVAALFVLKTLLTLFGLLANHQIIEKDRARVENLLFSGYLRARYVFHLQHNSAEFVHEMTSRVDSLFEVLAHATSVLNNLLIAGGILIVLLTANPLVTAVAAGLMAALVTLGLWATRRANVALGERADALELGRLRSLWQGLGAIKEIRVLGRERHFSDAFAKLQDGLLRNRYLGAVLSLAPRIVTELAFVITMLIAVAFLVRSDGVQAELLPILGLYAYAGLRLIPMVAALTESFNRIRWNRWSLEQLSRDFDLLNEQAEAEGSGRSPITYQRELELCDVSFSYPTGASPALRGISMRIRKGESIGVVGATGAGKSTLAHIIAALLEPSTGAVKVDGVDVRDCPVRWRRRLGYVPQAVHLLDESLRRNIALGVADESIDDGQIMAALHTARLDAFVATLPQGLDTLVGEGGGFGFPVGSASESRLPEPFMTMST